MTSPIIRANSTEPWDIIDALASSINEAKSKSSQDNMTPEEFQKKEETQESKMCTGSAADCEALDMKRNERLRVGMIMPKNIKSNLHEFQICRDKDCVPGGSIATYGYKDQADTEKRVSKESHVILYDDVTDLVKSKGWTAEKLEAQMTSSPVTGMPQPLVIVRNENEKEIVRLGPKQRIEDYGDLLDDYVLV